jgi:hypothetical protein
MSDLKLPWTEVAKGDLVVRNSQWKKVKYVRLKNLNGEDCTGNDEWASYAEVGLEDIESNEMEFFPAEAHHQVRVRPVAPDPWMGRRKEGGL